MRGKKSWKQVRKYILGDDGFRGYLDKKVNWGPFYPPYSGREESVGFDDGVPVFYAVLTPQGYSRGRSSVTYQFSIDGDDSMIIESGPSTTAEILKALASEEIGPQAGGIGGLWTFEKQGSSLYVRPARPEEIKEDA